METGFEPVYTDLQSRASPLGHSTARLKDLRRADDGTRTRDIHLGKVMRYQLRYIRVTLPFRQASGREITRLSVLNQFGVEALLLRVTS